MTEVVTVTDIGNPETAIKRDSYGRYRIPHPDTGKEQSWTRATTLANTLADRFGLEKWAKRNVALGLAARNDLYARVASCKATDTKTLDALVKDAEEAAASSSGANLGTALHRFTERLDAGEDITVPPPWDKDVAAYTERMTGHGITVVPGWIERVLVVPALGVAGMCDRLLTAEGWQMPRIGDLKTGKDVLRYGMTEIALQLSIYAAATHWYDPATDTVHEITERIDLERALVMHLPVGQATCMLYEVDIQAGWEAVRLAMEVRAWRKRKDLAELIIPTHVDGVPVCDNCGNSMEYCEGACVEVTPVDPDGFAWLHERVQAIKAAGYGALLAAEWSKQPHIPTFPKGGPQTLYEFQEIDAMCDRVEAQTDMPFGPTNPAAPTATKRKSST